MIYVEDVFEALLFAPDIKGYESRHKINEIGLMVSKRSLIPYVRRELICMLGEPSSAGDTYQRYGNLVIYFVSDPTARNPFNTYFWDGHNSDMPVFYVREKGERIGNKPHEVQELITTKWVPLVLSSMPEHDAWLHLSNHLNENATNWK